MIDLTYTRKVYLYSGATDFRKGPLSLASMVKNDFDLDHIEGFLFVFCNSSKTSIKILERERTGFSLYQKKLDKGKFEYPQIQANAEITPDELRILVSGLDFVKILESAGKKINIR